MISILQLVVAYTTSKYSFYRNYDDCYVFWKSISRMSQWEHILVTIQMEKSSYWRFYRMYLLYVEVIFVISTLLKYLYKRKSRIHKGIYILKLVYAVSVFFFIQNSNSLRMKKFCTNDTINMNTKLSFYINSDSFQLLDSKVDTITEIYNSWPFTTLIFYRQIMFITYAIETLSLDSISLHLTKRNLNWLHIKLRITSG